MFSIETCLQEQLLKDEQILWQGRPDPEIIFSPNDAVLIPFSLLWGGFAMFWEFIAFKSVRHSHAHADTFFPVFGIPFVLMGLYFVFGRFFYKVAKKKRTYYMVTNQRVLSIEIKGEGNVNTQAAFLKTLPAINKSIGSSGFGTIVFGNGNPRAAMYMNSGMEFFGGSAYYGPPPLAFYDIKDVETVYQMVNQMRAEG